MDSPFRLLSGDLSKASDYILWSVARPVLDGIAKACDFNPAETWLLNTVCSPKTNFENCEDTQRAMHMGLPLAWAVLCILNAWASVKAGVPLKGVAICGDDIIALCTSNEADAIEENLTTRLKLRINVKKSWRGERGVFCEALVKMTSSTSAIVNNLTTLTEISAPRVACGLSAGKGVLDALSTAWLDRSNCGLKRKIAYEECYQLGRKWKRLHGLPTWMGGNGLRTSRPLTKMARRAASTAIAYGRTMPVKRETQELETIALRTALNDKETSSAGVKLTDVSALIDAHHDRIQLLGGNKLSGNRSVPLKSETNFVYKLLRHKDLPRKEIARSEHVTAASRRLLHKFGQTSRVMFEVHLKTLRIPHKVARKFASDSNLLAIGRDGVHSKPRSLWPKQVVLPNTVRSARRAKRRRGNPLDMKLVLHTTHVNIERPTVY
jgi:hypothetical protein